MRKPWTALQVARLKTPGRYAAGENLYLQIAQGGTKSWLFQYMIGGRARAMGLGSTRLVTLAEAREKAREARRLILAGIDPLEAREAARRAAVVEAARSMTFRQCAEAYIAAHEAAWRNPKHRQQWRNTLATYAYPIFGDLPVAAVDTGFVMACLEPLWATKAETAGRLRGRIEVVIDWAKVRGHRSGENPARWKGHLAQLLPSRSKVRAVQHHAALPFAQLPDFLCDLRKRDGVAARALEFAIFTAARTGEAIGATWAEVDLATKTWTIPATRMKSGKEHRVPLSDRAIEILTSLPCEGDFIFIGGRAGRPLSNMALLETLRRMGRGDITTHGFRSSFRDWAAERTSFQGEVVEAALAHAVGNKVEAAYRRGDLFEKRRLLMDAWASFVTASPANVIALRA